MNMPVYVLLRIEPERLMKVYAKIERIEGVEEVGLITGSWDIIVKFPGENVHRDLETIVRDILTIPGVKESETMISTRQRKP
jgi:DNA-binding Lrp family transcriptional regulator